MKRLVEGERYEELKAQGTTTATAQGKAGKSGGKVTESTSAVDRFLEKKRKRGMRQRM